MNQPTPYEGPERRKKPRDPMNDVGEAAARMVKDGEHIDSAKFTEGDFMRALVARRVNKSTELTKTTNPERIYCLIVAEALKRAGYEALEITKDMHGNMPSFGGTHPMASQEYTAQFDQTPLQISVYSTITREGARTVKVEGLVPKATDHLMQVLKNELGATEVYTSAGKTNVSVFFPKE